MGYLSQKKKYEKTKEILNLSLIGLLFCCVLLLFYKESYISQKIRPWLFQIYIFTLIAIIYAGISKFYWHTLGLIVCSVFLFFNLARGGNLFFNVETKGTQNLNILYQIDGKNILENIEQIKTEHVDIATILKNSTEKVKEMPSIPQIINLDNGLIFSKYKVFRSGEVLLSEQGKAVFADIKIKNMKLMLITLNFSALSSKEQEISLHNLAEFINMQDIPVIVIGDFGQESWSINFLSFLEKTKLEVKNSIILRNGGFFFNPLKVPTINVLAYKDFGIQKINFLPATKDNKHPLLIRLNY